MTDIINITNPIKKSTAPNIFILRIVLLVMMISGRILFTPSNLVRLAPKRRNKPTKYIIKPHINPAIK